LINKQKGFQKKYLSLRKDLGNLVQKLQINPNEGTPLGNGFYKIRLQITSKGKGKSGGGRVITYVKITAATVYLSSIYDKGERDTITNRELDQIFKEISGK
jgi:hypothetical protein